MTRITVITSITTVIYYCSFTTTTTTTTTLITSSITIIITTRITSITIITSISVIYYYSYYYHFAGVFFAGSCPRVMKLRIWRSMTSKLQLRSVWRKRILLPLKIRSSRRHSSHLNVQWTSLRRIQMAVHHCWCNSPRHEPIGFDICMPPCVQAV